MSGQTIAALYLESARFRFQEMKRNVEKALQQLSTTDLGWRPNAGCNSIAVLIQHLHGNMRSRWTDFLTSDGEKPWRDRDGEFMEPETVDREALVTDAWESGWRCLFDALDGLRPEDLAREVWIRGQAMTALDAINRQLCHYAYHSGQIVRIAMELRGEAWESLTIPRGQSQAYRPAKRD